jgi:hypothetical protein
MRVPTKEALLSRLHYSPFLRLLLLGDVWVRLAILIALVVGTGLVLLLGEFWTVTPPGFSPRIKITGLDYFQAKALQRSARRAQLENRYDTALFAWRSALANHPGDLESLRGFLRTLIEAPEVQSFASVATHQSIWLLRLTQTNLSDLELFANVSERLQSRELAALTIESHAGALTPPLEKFLLRFYFDQNEMEAFATRWERRQDRNPDTELGLYRVAYDAGWGPRHGRLQARKALLSHLDLPESKTLATRLLLRVAFEENDLAAYEKYLASLVQSGLDQFAEHLRLWKLMAAAGQKETALNLARQSSKRPEKLEEVNQLAVFFAQYEQFKESVALFETHSPALGAHPQFWIHFAERLIEARQWEDLLQLALTIRTQDHLQSTLPGFSHFIEGLSELRLGRSALAQSSFEKVMAAEFANAGLAVRVARGLIEAKQHAIAKNVLLKWRAALPSDYTFWLLLFAAADETKDVPLMLESSERAYALRPADPVAINNRAATLLIAREKPEEAVRLSLILLARFPNSIIARINHGAALLINNRVPEAEMLLQQVPTNHFTMAERSLYHFDWFEICLKRTDPAEAERHAQMIDPDFLYPPQRTWFSEACSRLGLTLHKRN